MKTNDANRPEDWSGRGYLYKLLKMEIGKDIDVDVFCSEYEHTYNFDLDLDDLSMIEHEIFEKVFDVVVWYSPFSDEREVIPHYKDEHDVVSVVKSARSSLGIRM